MNARKPRTRRGKQQRSAWWASRTPEERAAYAGRKIAEKGAAPPSAQALEAETRLDIATERGIFMTDVPDEDVAARLAERAP